MGSTGSGSRNQTATTKQEQNPWGPTIQPLTDIVGQLNGQIGNTGVTSNEQQALGQMMQNAQAGNPYAGQISGLATDLLNGGADRSGYATNAYNDYKAQAQPYLSADYTNPYSNPAFKSYLDTTANDIQNRVNGMFAGSGRDLSGMNQQTLARGITEGTAPIFANQYNQNVATQRGVMDNLYNAGNTSAGLLSGLDQTALGNRQAGVNAAGAALDAQNYGPAAVLQAASAERNLPLQNIGNVQGLLTQLAGLGGTSSGTANSQMQYTQPLAQTVGQWMDIGNAGLGFMKGLFSDRRLKENIRKIGKLDNGLNVYSFRYKGDPRTVIGLMADEVEKVRPEAVGEFAGYKTVDYSIAAEAA